MGEEIDRDRILERITRMCIAHVYARAGVSD